MKYIKILSDYFGDEIIFRAKRNRLIVFLGSFADFDSFEYCQQLTDQSNLLAKYSVDLIVIGIGSEKSKENFCKFIQIDKNNVYSVNNADLHKQLNLNSGLILPLPPLINLLIMCAGINSKGTIKEVLRGYLGDIKADRIFSSDEIIKIGTFSLFKGKMFEVFSKRDVLRPFELATRRLMNMIEILTNWNIYVPDVSFLTQRGATILINEKDQVLYEFFSEGLLCYSSNMSRPLSFLSEFLKLTQYND
tara:strand:+ start:166 stop:909 length:744 start_codon:yes stop_codon:yes gene_type:complete